MADASILNGWGTGMLGVSQWQWNPADPSDLHSEMGLTWIQQGFLMFRN
jgi:hypothetical protein